MIHTDGRTTISNAPRRKVKVGPVETATGAHPQALLDRTTAGLRVQVAYLPLTDIALVQCSIEDRVYSATIPKDKCRDAFHHPMLYLSEAQVKALWTKTETDEVAGHVIDLSDAETDEDGEDVYL